MPELRRAPLTCSSVGLPIAPLVLAHGVVVMSSPIASAPLRGLAAVLVVLLPLPSVVAQSPPVTEALVHTGEAVPGFPAGAVFNGFLGPRLDATTGTIFYGTASGGGVTPLTDQGVFLLSPSGLTLLVREGDLAPQTAQARFVNLASGIINPPALGLDSAGALAFTTRLIGGDVCDCNGDGILDNDSAMYRQLPGGLQLLARADGQVPGEVPGLKFDLIVGQPLIAENGTLVSVFVFKGTGVTIANGVGLMTAAEGEELAMAVREGDPVPGLPAGTVLATLGRPFVGPQGDFSFFGTLKGPGVDNTNDDVVLAMLDGALVLVARQGDVLPSGDVLGLSILTGTFRDPSVRGGDKLAFTCLLADGGSAVVRDVDGSLDEVVRSGQQAPGLPEGTTFANFADFITNGPLQLGEDGRLAFEARLSTPMPSNESLWIADPDGTLHLLARVGDPPPSAPAGVTFGNGTGGLLPSFEPEAMDPTGRVAFAGNLAGTGLGLFSHGLYATDSSGTLRKVVQPGDQLDLQGDGSDLHTVADVLFNHDAFTAEAYNGPVFGPGGQLVFRVSFTDGSEGLFTSDVDGAFTHLGGGLAGAAGVPALSRLGPAAPLAPGSLDLAQAAGSAPALLSVAIGSSPLPFKGGVLLAVPPLVQIPLTTSGAGTFTLPFVTPPGVPGALELTLQVAVQDAAAVHGVAISSGLGAVTP